MAKKLSAKEHPDGSYAEFLDVVDKWVPSQDLFGILLHRFVTKLYNKQLPFKEEHIEVIARGFFSWGSLLVDDIKIK
jgi:hypothetical protein